jgi:hypothetical protein
MVRIKHFLALSCLVIVLSPVKSQNYQCSLCPVGKYKSVTQNAACLSCPQDTYQAVLGATSATACNPCPANSYSAPGSSSLAACGCAAGYSGDVGNYSLGVYTDDLARACTTTIPCITTSSRNLVLATNAIDGNVGTASWSDVVVGGDSQFAGMMPWWKVRFEREAVVQSVVIQNEDTTRQMSNFYIRVGNDDTFSNMNQQTLCAGPLTWTGGAASKTNTYACAAAVRGRYLYIINGVNAAVMLTEVKVRGYLAPATEACSICPAGSFKVASGPGTCTACAAGKASAIVGSTSAGTCTNCGAGTYAGAGSAACLGCPTYTNSFVNSQLISDCTCNKGYTPVPSTMSCNAFQTLYLAKRPWADYRATEWAVDKTLTDQSGNGRNSLIQGGNTAVTQATTSETVNGASKPLTYIKGGVSSELYFPQNSIPAQFTICSVTRYAAPSAQAAPTNYKRILTAATQDWLHGHVAQKRGVAYYGSRAFTNPQTLVVTPLAFNTAVENVGTVTNWLVMCGKNGGSTRLNVLVDGVASGESTRSDSDQNEWGNTTMDRATQLCINCRGDEKSDWELANLLIWDRHLNDTEMNTVSTELMKQLQTSEPLNSVCTQTPSNACSACVTGKYKSSQGAATCTDCAGGKYQQSAAAQSENECIPCPSNTDAPASSTAPANCRCLAGYSGVTDGQACAPCVKGSYKTSPGTGTCTQCAANFFSTTGAQTTSTCSSCPENSKSPAGSDEATDCVCDAGYTGANGAACLPCVSGTYKTAPGSQVCTLCGNNTYSRAVAATLANTCVACQGNSISVMGSDEWSDCKCLSGYLTNDIGLVNATCSQCVAGSYNPSLGATTCSKCAGGFKSSSPGAVAVEQCLACPTSTYSAPGAANCDTCPLNTFAPAPSVQLTDCKCLAGYYATNGQDGSTCQACPAGTFKPMPGAAACTQCPVNTSSTATAATSSSTCQACTPNAVSPMGSSTSSQCLCDFGYKQVEVVSNIANLARSCGIGSDACPVVVDSVLPWPDQFNPQFVGSHMNDGGTFGNGDGNGWNSNSNVGLHWARIEFTQSSYVTDFQLALTGGRSLPADRGWTNAGVLVGNNPDVLSTENSICTIIPSQPLIVGARDTYATYTCNTPVMGKYIFVSNRCNQGTLGVDRGNCGGLGSIFEVRVQGYTVNSVLCAACIAGTFKDTLGSAACTDCRADTYSEMSAARNASVCTPCYNNAITAAGSDSILDCGCSSGYEFLMT